MITETRRSERFGDLIGACLFGLLFLLLALWIRRGEPHAHIQMVRQWAIAMTGDPHLLNRLAGFSGFVLMGGVLITLGLPRIWFSAISGAIFGLGWGIVAAMLASMLGAAALFWLGGAFLATVARRRLAGKWARWQAGLRQDTFWWVLYLRLFPFSNATLASLICGSCRVRFTPFVYASLIGFLPYTVVFAAFGHGGLHGKLFQIVIGFVFLGATVGVRQWLMRYQPQQSLPPEL